jgi:hypothetical protein
MTTKKGPQGQAMVMSLSEITLLPTELLDDISLVGGSKLKSKISALTAPH